MKTRLLASLSLIAASTMASMAGIQKLSMVFYNTDVGLVLKAIALRSGVNIVYVGTNKVAVSVNVKVDTAEQAIQSVAASGSLVYRRVDGIYIVASPKDMRQALEPYATQAVFTPGVGKIDEIVQRLSDTVPYATFRSFGNKIEMTGLLDDIQTVRRYVDDYRTEMQARNFKSEVVGVQYAKPSVLQPVLVSLYPDLKATATEGEAGGSIALQGSELDIQGAERALAKMDRPGPDQDTGETVFRIYTLKYASGPEVVNFLKSAMPSVQAIIAPETYVTPRPQFNPLSASLGGGASSFFGGSGSSGGSSTGGSSNGQNQQGGTGGGSSQNNIPKPGDKAKAVVLRGRASAVDQALALIAKLDLKPAQIIVECRVLQSSPTFSEDLGLDWNLTNTQTITEGVAGAAGIGLGRFTRTTPLSFSATLNASILKGEAKILADPKIQATDNQDAFIFVGNTVNVSITSVGALGAQAVTPLQFPVGIILTIRARVGADGTITMHVNPVVSTITSFNSDGFPQTASSEAETTAVIKDGDTMAIGGLIRDDFARTITEVPILSQIPFLGELFKNRSTTHNKVDVIVTLTPHIVKDSAEVIK